MKNREDRELLKLHDFLIHIKDHPRVTEILDTHFQLSSLQSATDLQEAMSNFNSSL